MDAGGARLRAVGERLKQIGQLRVAVLFHEARQFVASRGGRTALAQPFAGRPLPQRGWPPLSRTWACSTKRVRS
jgi:hypothetical protein